MTEQLDHAFLWKHKKRGGIYQVLGVGELQSSNLPNIEGVELVAYKGTDGKLWFRPKQEFLDGRYEPITNWNLLG